MNLQERSYSGKLFRPSPEIHIEEDGSVGIIATPWGNRQGARRVIETLNDFIQSSRNDMEATSPFQKLSCLSPLANTLRVATMLANDALYREENRNEYTSGVELLLFSMKDGELSWVQIGQPNLYLFRKNAGILSLGANLDMTAELTPPSAILPPLPSSLLGLYSTSNFSVQSFRPLPGDHLLLLSRTYTPSSLHNLHNENISLGHVSTLLSQSAPELPFWLGHLDLQVKDIA